MLPVQTSRQTTFRSIALTSSIGRGLITLHLHRNIVCLRQTILNYYIRLSLRYSIPIKNMRETPYTDEETGKIIYQENMPMDLEEIQEYVTKNAEVARLPAGLPDATLIECIDDRRTNRPNERGFGDEPSGKKRHAIAYPGGAFGVLGTLLAATNELIQKAEGEKRELAQKELSFARITSFFEEALQGISCHTDDHSAGSESACAGCGHASAMLTSPLYMLGSEYQRGLAEYARDLERRSKEHDLSVTVYTYKGPHASRAVVRILKEPSEDAYISLPPNDGGNGMFVINEATDLYILESVGKKMYETFEPAFKGLGVSEKSFTDAEKAAYNLHVGLTAAKLAEGLPVYDVTGEDGKIHVTASNLRF